MVLVLGDVDAEMVDEEILLQLQNLRDVLKYAVIVVSTAPLMSTSAKTPPARSSRSTITVPKTW